MLIVEELTGAAATVFLHRGRRERHFKQSEAEDNLDKDINNKSSGSDGFHPKFPYKVMI